MALPDLCEPVGYSLCRLSARNAPSPKIPRLRLEGLCRWYDDRVELVGKNSRPAKVLGDLGKEFFVGHIDDVLAQGISQLIQGDPVRFRNPPPNFSMRRRIFLRLLSYSIAFNPLDS